MTTPAIPMNRRDILLGGSASASALALPGIGRAASEGRPPNFVIILCDDLGYGDVGVFGGRVIPTPNVDRMAHEGVMLTDYYAPANICTPSRAGLLTGRYPIRTGLGYEVIMAQDDRGLPLSEVTVATALKPRYASGLFGKWHLGHVAPFWPPTNHGFDKFFGIQYSHDMNPLAYYEDTAGQPEVGPTAVDFRQLQQQFYAHAEAFIEAHRDRPFFVELALSAPHLPEHPHPPFEGRTKAGPFGDVVAEIDSIVGRLMAKLRALDLERDTLVIFTSDNGPWFEGSAGGLRDRKGGAGYDGGYRVPFIVRQPGVIPAGKLTGAIACGIDILPTLCAMAGASLPAGVELDGKDITAVLKGGAASPHDEIVLFDNEDVVGIRTQAWKYVGASYYRGLRLPFSQMNLAELYDATADRDESYSVAANHPEVAAAMNARLSRAQGRFAALKHKDVPPVFKQLRERMGRLQD